jgi:hypothetical protein
MNRQWLTSAVPDSRTTQPNANGHGGVFVSIALVRETSGQGFISPKNYLCF